MQVRKEVPPICDQPSMNGHTYSGIYDLAQTLSGEILRQSDNKNLSFSKLNIKIGYILLKYPVYEKYILLSQRSYDFPNFTAVVTSYLKIERKKK